MTSITSARTPPQAVTRRRTISGGLIRTVVAESPEDLFWSWLIIPPRPLASLVLRRYTCGRQHVDSAVIPAGSRKAVLKKFENVSELGSKRQ
jgi:hypothetical protein